MLHFESYGYRDAFRHQSRQFRRHAYVENYGVDIYSLIRPRVSLVEMRFDRRVRRIASRTLYLKHAKLNSDGARVALSESVPVSAHDSRQPMSGVGRKTGHLHEPRLATHVHYGATKRHLETPPGTPGSPSAHLGPNGVAWPPNFAQFMMV